MWAMCVCLCVWFEQSKLMGCLQCRFYLLRFIFMDIGWWVVATGNLAPLPTQLHKFRWSATSLVPQHLRWRGGKTSACSSFRLGGSTIFLTLNGQGPWAIGTLQYALWNYVGHFGGLIITKEKLWGIITKGSNPYHSYPNPYFWCSCTEFKSLFKHKSSCFDEKHDIFGLYVYIS